MSRPKSLGCLASSAIAATFCRAQSSTQGDSRAADKRILQEIQERNQLMENIEYLSDAIGPRSTGSEQLRTAEAWAASVADHIHNSYPRSGPSFFALMKEHALRRGSLQDIEPQKEG